MVLWKTKGQYHFSDCFQRCLSGKATGRKVLAEAAARTSPGPSAWARWRSTEWGARVARDGNTLIQVSRMGTVVVSQPDADSPVLGDQKQSHAVCVQLPSLRLFWLSPKPGHGFPMGVISCLAEQLLPLGAPSLRPGCQWKWGLAAIITINLAAFLPLSAATEATVDGCAVQGQVPNLKSCFFAFSQGWFYQHL